MKYCQIVQSRPGVEIRFTFSLEAAQRRSIFPKQMRNGG